MKKISVIAILLIAFINVHAADIGSAQQNMGPIKTALNGSGFAEGNHYVVNEETERDSKTLYKVEVWKKNETGQFMSERESTLFASPSMPAVISDFQDISYVAECDDGKQPPATLRIGDSFFVAPDKENRDKVKFMWEIEDMKNWAEVTNPTCSIHLPETEKIQGTKFFELKKGERAVVTAMKYQITVSRMSD